MIQFIVLVAGAALIVAAPIMIFQGVVGRRTVMRELTQQHITFPAGAGLPAALSRYAGRTVRTGTEARAYSDLIAGHVAAATGGRTYAEIADEWQAGARTDERLRGLRETAFMGQSLRGTLLGAYQAWQITVLVMGLGALCAATGVAFVALALR
ncbi:hypothetical protein [Actinoplanes sp. NPDC049599]|uniref:hypothetical protein n=1 Tax=Actinoplanes sp. NPDC049599 TaxID=3363903 RepID=UPI0037B2A18E